MTIDVFWMMNNLAAHERARNMNPPYALETDQSYLEHLLEDIKGVVCRLEKMAHRQPLQTNVVVQVNLNNLREFGFTPDAFVSPILESEARKTLDELAQISEFTRELMSDEEQQECRACAEAKCMQARIEKLERRQAAYLAWAEARDKMGEADQWARKVGCWLPLGYFSMWIGLPVIFLARFMPNDITAIAAVFLGIGLLIVPPCVALSFDIPKEKKLSEAKKRLDLCALMAGADAGEFWEWITKTFGGMPTAHQMSQKWAEQEPVIRKVFDGALLSE
jgi:hypothetical protein